MLIDVVKTLIGFVLLIWGADRFVLGASATARNLGVSPLLIGLTIVALATSAPEILVSIVAALRDDSDLAIGNAIGSNIANIALVLGTAAIVRPLEIRSETLRREMPALLAVTLLTIMLFLDSVLSRPEGVVLIAGLGLVMYWMIKLGFRSAASDPIRAEFAAEIPSDVKMAKALFWFSIGIMALLFGSLLLVAGSVDIARTLGISKMVVGLTFVAVGTSLPELAVTVVAALKNEHDLAIGNIIGSNMFNLLAVVGAAITISPLSIGPTVLTLHLPMMVGLTLVLFAMAYNFSGESRIKRSEGVLLLLSFFIYHGYVISSAI